MSKHGSWHGGCSALLRTGGGRGIGKVRAARRRAAQNQRSVLRPSEVEEGAASMPTQRAAQHSDTGTVPVEVE